MPLILMEMEVLHSVTFKQPTVNFHSICATTLYSNFSKIWEEQKVVRCQERSGKSILARDARKKFFAR